MINSEQVISYLEENPNFFRQHSFLLDVMQVEAAFGGRATSLTEHHLLKLREQNNHLVKQIDEMIDNAVYNQQTANALHLLTLELLENRELPQMLIATQANLTERFDLPFFGIRFWQDFSQTVTLPEFAGVNPAYQSFADTLIKPYCGATHGLDLSSWFGEEVGDRVKSQAIIPLKMNGSSFGLFALGSTDESRFHENMGTMFLENLGELLSAAVSRFLP